jgi:hypothetical protein
MQIDFRKCVCWSPFFYSCQAAAFAVQLALLWCGTSAQPACRQRVFLLFSARNARESTLYFAAFHSEARRGLQAFRKADRNCRAPASRHQPGAGPTAPLRWEKLAASLASRPAAQLASWPAAEPAARFAGRCATSVFFWRNKISV